MLRVFRYLGGGLLALVALLLLVYVLGPRPSFLPVDAEVSQEVLELEGPQEAAEWLHAREAAIKDLRPNNDARVIWADSARRTEWVIVYLHGYSAGPREGDPVVREMAARYGANLLEARLTQHGRKMENPFLDLEPQELTRSAAEALQLGSKLGDKVLLVTCSTGSTVGLWLAANEPELVEGVICWSPNVDLEDKNSSLLLGPWGLQLAHSFFPDGFREFEADDSVRLYWTNRYRVEGLLTLKSLVTQTMTKETFAAIDQPVFIGLWYKSEEERDMVVSREAAQIAFSQLGTPEADKVWMDFANVDAHVLASRHYSKDLTSVRNAAFAFAENQMGMQMVSTAEEITEERVSGR